MIQKVIQKRKLGSTSQEREDLAYWLSRSPDERLAAVETLRRMRHGRTDRLERVARVIKRT